MCMPVMLIPGMDMPSMPGIVSPALPFCYGGEGGAEPQSERASTGW